MSEEEYALNECDIVILHMLERNVITVM